MKIIGGEFSIDIRGLQQTTVAIGNKMDAFLYSSGRSALYFILLDIQKRYGIKTIMLPDYLCSSVVKAANKADMIVEFYPLNDQLEIDRQTFCKIYDDNKAVLLINYFGLKNIKSQTCYVRSLNPNAVLIEDDVQAFYEFEKPLNDLNYKFTSLRKSFAIPDGGLVKTSHKMDEPNLPNKFHQYKFAGGILKDISKPEYYDDGVYLSILQKGEVLIDEDITTGISQVAKDILSKTDTEYISQIRRNNAKVILDGLNSLNIKTVVPVSADSTPLFIPIWLSDRNRTRRFLFQHNCFCPVHWPLEGMDVKKGSEMAEHELSIIVDQRYTNFEMVYILELIDESLK